jgi:phosphate acetyltransferase
MSNLISKIKEKAKSLKLGLVLPEAGDIRVLKAAEIIKQEGLAKKVVLLGSPSEILKKAKSENINLSDIEIVDYLNSEKFQKYSEEYCNLRKAKGMTPEEAKETLKDPTYYGMFMVKEKEVDTLVSGSLATTATVMRATIHIIGLDSTSRTISSCFLMVVPDCAYGENGSFLFADCGTVPDPTPEQLADIAINTAKTAKSIFETEPKVAMLSFSTKGSATHRLLDKVIKATAIAKEKAPDLLIDGELQADSAIVPEIAQRKLSGSPVAGKANVLVFPDLNSGNICYKLVERLARAQAFGPLTQGIPIPISDLSRGCSVNDIVVTSAITLMRAGVKK